MTDSIYLEGVVDYFCSTSCLPDQIKWLCPYIYENKLDSTSPVYITCVFFKLFTMMSLNDCILFGGVGFCSAELLGPWLILTGSSLRHDRKLDSTLPVTFVLLFFIIIIYEWLYTFREGGYERNCYDPKWHLTCNWHDWPDLILTPRQHKQPFNLLLVFRIS